MYLKDRKKYWKYNSQKENNLYGPSSKYLNLNEDIFSGQGNYISPQGNIIVQDNN